MSKDAVFNLPCPVFVVFGEVAKLEYVNKNAKFLAVCSMMFIFNNKPKFLKRGIFWHDAAYTKCSLALIAVRELIFSTSESKQNIGCSGVTH
jgi:hypothetical protein